MVPCSLSLHFPADRPENTPWRKSASFPPGGPRSLSSECQCRAGAAGCLLRGPTLPPVSSHCLSHPGKEPDVALSHVPLFHSSGLFYLFQISPFLPNSVFILSTFTASSHFHHLSSLCALIFLILSHPSLSSPHKQRTKATKQNL